MGIFGWAGKWVQHATDNRPCTKNELVQLSCTILSNTHVFSNECRLRCKNLLMRKHWHISKRSLKKLTKTCVYHSPLSKASVTTIKPNLLMIMTHLLTSSLSPPNPLLNFCGDKCRSLRQSQDGYIQQRPHTAAHYFN